MASGTLTINVKLNNPGNCAGPCDIFTDADGYSVAIATGISITVLTSPTGYNITVPDSGPGTPTIFRVVNNYLGCGSNYIDIPIQF